MHRYVCMWNKSPPASPWRTIPQYVPSKPNDTSIYHSRPLVVRLLGYNKRPNRPCGKSGLVGCCWMGLGYDLIGRWVAMVQNRGLDHHLPLLMLMTCWRCGILNLRSLWMGLIVDACGAPPQARPLLMMGLRELWCWYWVVVVVDWQQ